MLDRKSLHRSLNGQPQSPTTPQVNGLSEVEPSLNGGTADYQAAHEAAHETVNGGAINGVTVSATVNSGTVNSGAVSAAGMVLQLADGQIAACNANAERIMGMTATQMIGWQSTGPSWRVVREDGTSFPGEEHPARVALTTGKPCRDVVMGFYQPNGRLVWLRLNSQPLFEDSRSKPYAVLTTLTEIPQANGAVSRSIAENFTNSAIEPTRNGSPAGVIESGTNSKNENGNENSSKYASVNSWDKRQPAFQVQSTLSLLIAENQFLRDREEQLRLALEGADLGLWDYDLEANQLVWSNRCKTLFGVPTNTAITYDRFLETVHPEDRSTIDDAIQQAIHAPMSGGYDLEIRLRDGLLPIVHSDIVHSDIGYSDIKPSDRLQSCRWIRLKGNVYRSSAGQPQRMIGIAIDITNRKWAERELADSQAQFQAFMDNSPTIAFIKDEAGRICYVNRMAEHLLELPSIGRTDFDFLPVEIAAEIQQHDRRVLECSETVQTIETIPDRAGQLRSWLVFKFSLPPVNGEKRLGGMGIAITEQQQAEAQFRDSQQFIQQVADAVPGLLYVYDLIEQRNVYVNQQIQEILGYSPAQIEALGSNLFAQLIHPADLSMIPVHYARFDRAQPNEVFECEYRMRNAEGEWRWFLSRDIVFRRTEDGQVWQILGTAQDITERRQIEQSLQDSQARYAALAQNVPGVIYQYQQLAEGRTLFHYISLDCEELLGVSQATVLADAKALYATVHPDDRDAFHASQQIDQDTETQWQHEWRVLHPSGSTKWVKGFARAQKYSDGSVLWDGIMFDVTAAKHLEEGRKQAELALRSSEERYRCLAESIPQLIWTANADGGLDDINQRWSDYTGLTLEQARIDGWVQIVHSDDAPALLQIWLQAQQTQSLYQAECRMRSKIGEYRWFLVKAMPVKDDQGNVVKWYGTFTDIDDQKQLALERLRALELEQAARSEAERTNRIKDELLMMLSHELRTPLNPILGWSQLLQRREFNREKTVAALRTIERNAQRQLQLVEDLLDVAKVLQGEIRLKPSWVNLAEPIETAIASIRTMAETKQIELETKIAAADGDVTEPYRIWGDAVRLQQIAWNLLANAVKFTPPGGKITVRFAQTPEVVQLQVSDTGIGIDPAFLPHVFERFRQSNSSTTREHGGLGLGLAIVRHLVELHGGTVGVESPGIGVGATFTVQLPLLRSPGDGGMERWGGNAS